MFKYIKGILSTISPAQRVLALSMLLVSITLITIGPKIAATFRPDDAGLRKELKIQHKRIIDLIATNDTLSNRLITETEQCTDELLREQLEFKRKLRELEKELVVYDEKITTSVPSYHVIERREEKTSLTYDTIINKKVYAKKLSAVNVNLSTPSVRNRKKQKSNSIIVPPPPIDMGTIERVETDTVLQPKYNTNRTITVDTIRIDTPKLGVNPVITKIRNLLNSLEKK